MNTLHSVRHVNVESASSVRQITLDNLAVRVVSKTL